VSAGDSSLVLGSRQAVISNDSVRCAGSTPGRTFPVVDGRNRWDRTKGLGRSCLPSRARSSRCPGFGPDGSRADLYSKRQPVRFAPLCRVGRRRLRPVLKHGPRSLTCMRAIGLTKPSGAVKAKSCLQLEGRRVSRSPAISNQPRIVGNTQSIDVGTRKMVNYAWPG